MNVTYRPYTFLSFFLVSNDFVLIKKRSIVMIYIFIFLLFSLILLAGVTAFFSPLLNIKKFQPMFVLSLIPGTLSVMKMINMMNGQRTERNAVSTIRIEREEESVPGNNRTSIAKGVCLPCISEDSQKSVLLG